MSARLGVVALDVLQEVRRLDAVGLVRLVLAAEILGERRTDRRQLHLELVDQDVLDVLVLAARGLGREVELAADGSAPGGTVSTLTGDAVFSRRLIFNDDVEVAYRDPDGRSSGRVAVEQVDLHKPHAPAEGRLRAERDDRVRPLERIEQVPRQAIKQDERARPHDQIDSARSRDLGDLIAAKAREPAEEMRVSRLQQANAFAFGDAMDARQEKKFIPVDVAVKDAQHLDGEGRKHQPDGLSLRL